VTCPETNKKKSEKDKELKEAIAEEKTLKAKVGNNKTPADEEALKQAKEKRTQLELWIKEAEVKLKKVQLSLAELNKGINQSQIRRQKAEEEIETIRKNEAEFEKLLAQYTQRKATLEKLAKKSQQ
jgi:predicted  nucleic acid-binding Zn-ribbon protein